MSALLTGIYNKIKDRNPDSYSYHEELRDVTRRDAGVFHAGELNLSRETQLFSTFTWAWKLEESTVSCILRPDPTKVVEVDSQTSMYVSMRDVEWRYNGQNLTPDNDLELRGAYTVSFYADERRKPTGLMTLLRVAYEVEMPAA